MALTAAIFPVVSAFMPLIRQIKHLILRPPILVVWNYKKRKPWGCKCIHTVFLKIEPKVKNRIPVLKKRGKRKTGHSVFCFHSWLWKERSRQPPPEGWGPPVAVAGSLLYQAKGKRPWPVLIAKRQGQAVLMGEERTIAWGNCRFAFWQDQTKLCSIFPTAAGYVMQYKERR